MIFRFAAKKGGNKEVATRKYLNKRSFTSRRFCRVLHLTELETRKVDEVLPVTAKLYEKMEDDYCSYYCSYCGEYH